MRSLVCSLSLLVAIGACVAVGSASHLGVDAWRTWQQKIQIHSAYLRGEVFDIGLSNLVGDLVSADRASADSYEQDIPHSLARRTAVHAHRPLWLSLAVVLMLLSVAAVWLVPQEAALAFGFVPLYALSALSPVLLLRVGITAIHGLGSCTRSVQDPGWRAGAAPWRQPRNLGRLVYHVLVSMARSHAGVVRDFHGADVRDTTGKSPRRRCS